MRRRADFVKAQAQGQKLYSRHFGVTIHAAAGFPRLGLAVTRRLGNAATRNRVKRLLREFFRRQKAALPPKDIVIMAKKGAEALTYPEVEQELRRLLLARRGKEPAGD